MKKHLRDDAFKGMLFKSYKPICFKHNGFDVEIKIQPGWEYQISFEATKDNYWFYYIFYNIDNGYNTKKKIIKNINEMLKWLDSKNCNCFFKKFEQLEFDF